MDLSQLMPIAYCNDDYCLSGSQQAMVEAGLDHTKFNKFNNIAWATHTKQPK